MPVVRTLCLALLLAFAPAPTLVGAQALMDNDFAIDLAQPLVLGSGRALGMSGALTALASGIEGVPWNPAGYVNRDYHQQDWFDYSLAFSMTFPGAFGNDDFFNNGLGRRRGIAVDDSTFVDVGFGLLFGDGGGGVLVRTQTFELASESGERIDVDALTVHLGAGYAFLRGDVVVGIGARIASFDVTASSSVDPLIELTGAGVEIGVQLRPEDAPWSAGLSGRSPAAATVAADAGPTPDVVAGYLVPRRVVLPWELEGGFAYQFGARPLHRRRLDAPDADMIVRRELLREQCERLRAQSIEEAEGAATAAAALPPRWDGRDCLGGLARPTDPGFWEDEAARRAVETRFLEDQIDETGDRLDLERQRALDALPRRYLLVSGDLIVYGKVENAIGLDAFFDQERRLRAERASVGYRLGLEGEPWSNRLKLRTGSYLEPSRTSGVGPRAHFTFGWDLRLFRWAPFGPASPWDFRVGSNFDVARDYFDIGIGFGFWH